MDEFSHKIRVLIVEDVQDVIDSLKRKLAREDVVVFQAQTFEEARALLDTHHFNVLIVDIGLVPQDANNTDGLKIFEYVQTHYPERVMVRFMFTGTTNDSLIARMLAKYQLQDYFKKGAGAEDDLMLSFDRWMKKPDFRVNLKLDYDRKYLIEAAYTLQERDSEFKNTPYTGETLPLKLYHEMQDILGRLFFGATKLIIEPLNPGMTASALFKVRPVFRDEGEGNLRVVKFGRRDKIEIEYERYTRYVVNILDNQLNVFDIVSRRHLGGVCYQFAINNDGDAINEFDHLYLSPHIEQEHINASLDRLFQTNLRRWYFPNYANNEPERRDLIQHYAAKLNLSGGKGSDGAALTEEDLSRMDFEEQIARLFATLGEDDITHGQDLMGDTLRLTFAGGQYRDITNPLMWLKYRRSRLTKEIHMRITHGDLTGRNIMADNQLINPVPDVIEHPQPYYSLHLIDFARTERSHILRDFVIFETDLKYRLYLRDHVPHLEEHEAAERYLLGLPMRSFNFRDETRRLINTVRKLRSISLDIAKLPPKDWNFQYMVALLLATLNVSRFQRLSIDRRKHAILTAGLICDRLAQTYPDLHSAYSLASSTGTTRRGDNHADSPLIGALVERLHEQKVVLFIGHGVPADRKDEYTPQRLADKLAIDIPNYKRGADDSAEDVFQKYAEFFSYPELLQQHIEYYINAPKIPRYFVLSASLPWARVYTTNQHNFLEEELNRIRKLYDVVTTYPWPDPAAQTLRIYKANGSLPLHHSDPPNHLVMANKDYKRPEHRIRYSKMFEAMQNELEQSFLVMMFPTQDDLSELKLMMQSSPRQFSRVYVLDEYSGQPEKFALAKQFNPLLANPENILEELNRQLMG